MKSEPSSNSYRWWVVGMLWLVCVFNYADRQAVFAVFPKLEEEFGFSKIQLGLIGSSFMWVYAAGAPFAGWVADRVSRKKLILGGCVFWSIVTLLTAHCSKLWHFVVVRSLEGFGETFYFPASMSLLSSYHGKRTRSRAMGFHQSGVYIGTILGSWVGAILAATVGWRYGFYLFGGLGTILALVLFKILREPGRLGPEATSAAVDSPTAAPPLEFRKVFAMLWARPASLFVMLAFVCANFVATIFLTWTPTFLVQKFHFKLAAAGLSGTLFIHLASALIVPFGGWLADHLAMKRNGGRLLVQIGGLMVGSAFVWGVGRANEVSWLMVAMVGFGLCKGFYDANIFAGLYDFVQPEARATAAGLMNTVGWGGGAMGPLAVGWYTGGGSEVVQMERMSQAFGACAMIYVIGVLLLWQAFRMERNSVKLVESPV